MCNVYDDQRIILLFCRQQETEAQQLPCPANNAGLAGRSAGKAAAELQHRVKEIHSNYLRGLVQDVQDALAMAKQGPVSVRELASECLQLDLLDDPAHQHATPPLRALLRDMAVKLDENEEKEPADRLRVFLRDHTSLGHLLRSSDANILRNDSPQVHIVPSDADSNETFVSELIKAEPLGQQGQQCQLFVRTRKTGSQSIHLDLIGSQLSFLVDSTKFLPQWQQVEQVALAFYGQQIQEDLRRSFGNPEVWETQAPLHVKWIVTGQHGSRLPPETSALRLNIRMHKANDHVEVSHASPCLSLGQGYKCVLWLTQPRLGRESTQRMSLGMFLAVSHSHAPCKAINCDNHGPLEFCNTCHRRLHLWPQSWTS